MQISTPAQALSFSSESSSLKDTTVVEELNEAAPKNTKPGIFARLLEGLTAKGKKGRDLSEVNPGDSGLADLSPDGVLANSEENSLEGAGGLLTPGGVKKNTFFTGQGTKKPADLEFFDEKGALAGLPALFGQDLLQAEQGLTGEISLKKDGKTLAGKNFLNEAKPAKEGGPGFSYGKAGGLDGEADQSLTGLLRGKEDASGVLENRPERGGGEVRESLWNRAGKNSRGAIDFPAVSARETETKFHLLRQEGLLSPGGGEKENPRLADARGRKGRERLNIEVRDLRSGFTNTGSGLQAAGQEAEASKGLVFNAGKTASAEIEIPVNLRIAGGEVAGIDGGKTSGENFLNRGFEDALARELRGGLSTDIVRDAMVIVRNGGEGTIRLSLRPASLGDVKIRLEMTENKITGHIIVESKEALRAFERELPVLEKAFKDSGFSETNLEMSLAQDGWDFGSREQGQEGDFRFFSPVQAATRYEVDSEWSDMPDSAGTVFPVSTGRTSVNLFV